MRGVWEHLYGNSAKTRQGNGGLARGTHSTERGGYNAAYSDSDATTEESDGYYETELLPTRDYDEPIKGVRAGKAHRTVTTYPDGRQQVSEEYIGSTLPLAEKQLNLKQTRQQNDYELQAQELAYNFQNKQSKRQHVENVKHIEQIPTLQEIELRRQQQRFEEQKFKDAVNERKAQETRLFQANLTQYGADYIRRLQKLFKHFGFTKDDAMNPMEPRLSDPTIVLSRVGRTTSYVYSLLATGVAEIDENPFTHSITFVDGTRMGLPNAHHGYKCAFRREGSGIYVINVTYPGEKSLRKKHRSKYIASLICCDNKCNVQ